jgi:plasmid maintenance system antidote protein VapI
MPDDRTPAACFPLGAYLRDEMEARGLSAATLAAEVWVSESRLAKILDGGRANPREIECLAARLGVSAAVLVNLQVAYQRWARRQGRHTNKGSGC